MAVARSYLYDGSIGDAPPRDDWNPLQNVRKGWVEDRGQRRLLWLPVEWRKEDAEIKWFSDVAVMQFSVPFFDAVTIKLY